MKFITIITLTLIIPYSCALSQNWIRIPKTNIVYSNFINTNDDNRYAHPYAYFQKGDSLIAINQAFAQDFYRLFTENAASFDSIYQEAPRKMNKKEYNQFRFCGDTALLKINYQNVVSIKWKEEVYGYNEVIWVLTNVDWESNITTPCFINVSFSKDKDANGKLHLHFLSVKYQHCWL